MKVYTIKDIAKLAGVSVTTVSRVLNHRPDVSAATREKVERMMEEYHFVGNANARGLKQADSDLVIMILRGHQNTFLHLLAEAILEHSEISPALISPVYIDEQDNEFETAMHLIHEKRVRGVIFLGTRIDERAEVLQGLDIPVVVVTANAEGTSLTGASSVSVDDRAAACDAVNALLTRGHQHIAIFGGSQTGTDPMALRYQGAMDAFRQSCCSFDPALFTQVRFSVEDGYSAALALMKAHPQVTAIFCMSDFVAIGVLRALKDTGLRVPEDVSVIGFDGTDLSRFTVPRLSTVTQPVEALANTTLDVLCRQLSGEAPVHITIPATLALRESVR